MYQDDASRFVVGYGVFEEATGKHAVEVLKGAISVHGKPASVPTDRGSRFYAGEKEAAAGGEAEFEKELVALGIRHMLARAGRPQTGGKLARFYGELQRRLPHFVQSAADRTARGGRRGSEAHVGGPFYSAGQTDPVARLIRWYNHDRAHMSLGEGETPARAFARKMPRSGETAKDGATGEVYHAR